MNILFTTEEGPIKDIYFPAAVRAALESLGPVTYNDTWEPLTPQGLCERLQDIDICLTHWGCPTFDEAVLRHANRLKLITHAAGSVGDLVREAVYGRGIRVCSANDIMARHVAEGVLAYFLAAQRWIPQQAEALKVHNIWEKRERECRSLLGARIGLVGLGTIGRYLLDLLRPFGVQVKIYDPYLSPQALVGYEWAALADLDQVLAWGEIISLHCSLTPETIGLIDARRMELIQDGALFVNTARGAVVNEADLIQVLRSGRLRAVLDVYTQEPLAADNPLHDLPNVLLLPHMAGITAREEMSFAMLAEIQRFIQSQALEHEIPFGKFVLMTRER